MFAARTNHQLPKYMSYNPDPHAIEVNAFHHQWDKYTWVNFFPPFQLVTRVPQKVKEDHLDKVLMVDPVWPTQVWDLKFVNMTIVKPTLFKPSTDLLQLPSDLTEVHPLSQYSDHGMSVVRDKFKAQGLSKEVTKLLFRGWRKNTRKQYSIYSTRWLT